MVRRVGVIGYGNLGRFLASKILRDKDLELAFVWNRTTSNLSELDDKYILDNLENFADFSPDIVVEVAHPVITKKYGMSILEKCDYMIGSPTALFDDALFKQMKDACKSHALYIPSGAFWGGEDIRKLDEANELQSLTVTMKKHPSSLKVEGYLKDINDSVTDEPVTLFHGPVRDVCLLAPNNTNTMAVAAIAAPSLGFDGVTGCLISDPQLTNYHIVEIEAIGFPNENGSCFSTRTVRRNPAVKGEVTGQATYSAYFGSLKRASGRGPGIHLC